MRCAAKAVAFVAVLAEVCEHKKLYYNPKISKIDFHASVDRSQTDFIDILFKRIRFAGRRKDIELQNFVSGPISSYSSNSIVIFDWLMPTLLRTPCLNIGLTILREESQ